MVLRLYFVRHGETDENLERRIQGPLLDGPLNARGREQARRVAQFFADGAGEGDRLSDVWTSPLRRAHETARHVAEAAGAKLHRPRAGLKEYSWGKYLGQRDEGAVHDVLTDAVDRWSRGEVDHAPPEGESPRDTWRRASRALQTALKLPDGRSAAIVAHGRVNKVALSMLLHGDLTHQERFVQPNASVTLIERHGDAWRLEWKDRVDFLRDVDALAEKAS